MITAAASSAGQGSGLLVLIVVAVVVGYLVLARWFPWVPCRRCKGKGRFPAPIGRGWRNCPRCGGNGRRPRRGTRVLRSNRIRTK